MMPTYTAAPYPNAIVFHDRPEVRKDRPQRVVATAAAPPSNPDDCGCAKGTVCRQNGNCPRLKKLG